MKIKDYKFYCPGCHTYHKIDSRWRWNGDPNLPTIRPSIIIKTGTYADPQWVDVNQLGSEICHSLITQGRVQYGHDCTHPLAGMDVELPDL